MKHNNAQTKPDANRDPLTGEAGAHPVGVGFGSAGGATVGAVVGSLAGPVGTAVGAAVGGVAGGLSGKELAEEANPTVEDGYWREHYAAQPYVAPDTPYSAYQPAYRFGWEGRGRYGELDWEGAEPRLRADWQRSGGESVLGWDKARPAVRDAWKRLDDDYSDETR
jgi:hypothetical protein